MPRDYSDAAPHEFQRRPEHLREDEFIRNMLRRRAFGHLAHAWEDQPYTTPTNYWFDEANHRIVFHSNVVGRIRANLDKQFKACFELSEFGKYLPANTALEFSTQYRSVMVFGEVFVIKEPEKAREALYGLIKKYFPHFTAGKEYRPITDKELARTSVYEMKIASWSGKENWAERADQTDEWEQLSEELVQPFDFGKFS